MEVVTKVEQLSKVCLKSCEAPVIEVPARIWLLNGGGGLKY